jgi:hypothetical protein
VEVRWRSTSASTCQELIAAGGAHRAPFRTGAPGRSPTYNAEGKAMRSEGQADHRHCQAKGTGRGPALCPGTLTAKGG